MPACSPSRLIRGIVLILLAAALPASAEVMWVSTAGSDTAGDGSHDAPFATVQFALNLTGPGDTVIVGSGTFTATTNWEGFEFPADGTAAAPITLMAAAPLGTTLQNWYHTLFIDRDWIVVDGFRLTNNWGSNDTVRIEDCSHVTIRNCEIYNSDNDGIDMVSPTDVLIQNCTIRNCLSGSFTSQADSHGITGTGIFNIAIEDCTIYYCSGDCIQFAPDYLPWDNVHVRRCKLWTGPLPSASGNFTAGQTPGENAIDTKLDLVYTRAGLFIEDCDMYGFTNTPIVNACALNLKTNVRADVTRSRVHGSEWATRCRGFTGSHANAEITYTNCLFYGNTYGAIRFEDDVADMVLTHNTFWNNGFYNFYTSPDEATFTCRNNLFDSLPALAAPADGNTTAAAADFSDTAAADFHIASASGLIDTVSPVSGAAIDFDSRPRPNGSACEPGGYEYYAAAPDITVSAQALPAHVALYQPLELAVTVNGGHGVMTYIWDLQDGRTGYGPALSCVYQAEGIYPVEVTVTGEGFTVTDTVTVMVGPQPPVAVISILHNPTAVGIDPVLSGSGSSDPDGTITAYAWDLDYNGTDFGSDTTGSTPAVTFGAAGTRTVALRVTDNDGLTDIDTLDIVIIDTNLPPSAVISVTADPILAGGDPGLDGGSSADADGTITVYAWDFSWNGIDFNAEASGAAPFHTFGTAGVYTVALQVTDDDGDTDLADAVITVLAPDADADSDGLDNTDEFSAGTDPFDADSDADGMPDGWETDNGLNPVDDMDATADNDSDGFTNYEEFVNATDPNVNEAAAASKDSKTAGCVPSGGPAWPALLVLAVVLLFACPCRR